MNGKEIETTELGFFTQYVDLSLGNNTFTFTNNGKSKSITIVRQASDSSGSGSGASSSGITYWSKNHVAKYAVVKGNNISRMSKPGADGSSLMMPLAFIYVQSFRLRMDDKTGNTETVWCSGRGSGRNLY